MKNADRCKSNFLTKLKNQTMKQISKEAANSLLSHKSFKLKNTEVRVSDTKSELYLFGNRIAIFEKSTGILKVANCGWQTNTTKDRLNALPFVSICQKKGVWYLNGNVWNGNLIEVKK